MICLTNITKKYSVDSTVVYALRSLTLCIDRGEFVSIIGPSGSGKSTLMNIIGCLDRPDSGSYTLDGRTVLNMSDRELSYTRGVKIGFVFQQFNLLGNMTALENVALPLAFRGISAREQTRRAAAALAMVGLRDRISHRPGEMSGGQQQRVAIARALITNPSIILADEPTGNLDPASSGEVAEILQSLNRSGHTVVLITHDTHVATLGRRKIKISEGSIES